MYKVNADRLAAALRGGIAKAAPSQRASAGSCRRMLKNVKPVKQKARWQ